MSTWQGWPRLGTWMGQQSNKLLQPAQGTANNAANNQMGQAGQALPVNAGIPGWTTHQPAVNSGQLTTTTTGTIYICQCGQVNCQTCQHNSLGGLQNIGQGQLAYPGVWGIGTIMSGPALTPEEQERLKNLKADQVSETKALKKQKFREVHPELREMVLAMLMWQTLVRDWQCRSREVC